MTASNTTLDVKSATSLDDLLRIVRELDEQGYESRRAGLGDLYDPQDFPLLYRTGRGAVGRRIR